MISTFLTLWVAAFPVRGNLVTDPATSLILDGDTLKPHISATLGSCSDVYYAFEVGGTQWASNPTSLSIRSTPFPDRRQSQWFANFGLSARDINGHFPSNCWMGASIPQAANLAVVEGRSKWALWIDSAWGTSQLDPNTGIAMTLTDLKVSWRWSLIQNSHWVRWTDTIPALAWGTQAKIPLLSMLDTAWIDSIVPKPSQTNFSRRLTIQDSSRATKFEWSAQLSTGQTSRTDGSRPIPMGRILYVTETAADSTGTWAWYIYSQGRVQDSFFVTKTSTSGRRIKPIQSPQTSHVDLLGRHFQLPLSPTGRHLATQGAIDNKLSPQP